MSNEVLITLFLFFSIAICIFAALFLMIFVIDDSDCGITALLTIAVIVFGYIAYQCGKLSTEMGWMVI